MTKPNEHDAGADPAPSKGVRRDEFHVVGIGASAGGNDALCALLAGLPPDSGAAYVVAQHLAPEARSHLAERLARHTSMPVDWLDEPRLLEPDRVYLAPARSRVLFVDNRVEARVDDERATNTHSVDVLFGRLARSYAERTVAVVLSGAGSDGSAGVRAVKSAGGTVVVQDPDEAAFDGMPRSAISTGVVDAVLSPAEIADRLSTYLGRLGAVLQPWSEDGDEGAVDPLETLIEVLRRKSGFDFRLYKEGTIRRRLERRMALTQVGRWQDYHERLMESAAERDALCRDLLINVTSFFRDRDAFAALEERALRDIVEQADEGGEIRVWVPACSTGEEAFSIAILLQKVVDESQRDLRFRIFATDLDTRAIEMASSGLFDASIEQRMRPEVLRRCFDDRGGGYEIKRPLREKVVFAAHDVAQDPPFTRMDLVSCRNLLIYLRPELQAHVLSLLYFALRQKGYLFLGSSETPVSIDEHLEAVDTEMRLYRRIGPDGRPPRLRSLDRILDHDDRHPPPARRISAKAVAQHAAIAQSLVERDSLFALVVDGRLHLQHVYGDPGQALRVPNGTVTNEISALTRGDFRSAVLASVPRAQRTAREVVSRSVALDHGGAVEHVDVRVVPVIEGEETIDSFIVLVSRIDLGAAGDRELQHRVNDLEVELHGARDDLRHTVQDLECSNETLRSTNEELMVTNEELQSANEELHSTNDQLFRTNLDHEGRISELSEVTRDLENLFVGSEVGIVFLDEHLRVRKFTPVAAAVIHLLDQDVGRPLHHLAHGLRDVRLEKVAETALHTGQDSSQRVCTEHGEWYLLRALPYRIEDGSTAGVLLTLTDVTELQRVTDAMRASVDRFHGFLDALPDRFLWLNPDGTWLRLRDVASWRDEPPRVLGHDELAAFLSGPARSAVEEAARRSVESQELQTVSFDQYRGDTLQSYEARLLAVGDQGTLCVLRDVSELRRSERELVHLTRHLEQQANCDHLTQLPNRRGLEKILFAELERCRRLGVWLSAILVDCDDFKRVNDTLGHATGDVVLKEIGKRLRRVLRPSDTLGRVGGDEFLVLLPDTRVAEAMQLAERLRLAIHESPLTSGRDVIAVTGSLGVAGVPHDVVSIEEVISHAQHALQYSKNIGKNRVSTRDDEGDQALEDPREELMSVLETGRGFRTFVQPIFDLRNGETTGYELLTRGPGGALESPDDIFQLSSENNILTSVDLHCVKRNVQWAREYLDRGRFHLNLFPTTILDTPAARLLAVFGEPDLLQHFCVEISEQQFIGDPNYLRPHVEELRREGARIALDDVGFGRSSLESLLLLEPDTVKLDKSVVNGAATDTAQRRTLQRLVKVIRGIDADIVAEGIETEADRDLLLDLGVPFGQGYLLGRPRDSILAN